MRTVNVAELKNQLSAYLRFAKAGETVVVRDRNRPIAKLIPFLPEEGRGEHEELAAMGMMKLREKQMDWNEFNKLPEAHFSGEASGTDALTQALLDERKDGR